MDELLEKAEKVEDVAALEHEEVEETEEQQQVKEPEETHEPEEKEETDAEFDDGKPKQTKAENAEFARKRREAERKKAIKEAYEKGKQEALSLKEKETLEALIGGENHFTGEEITSVDEARIYQTMLAMKRAGKDPTDPKEVVAWQLEQSRTANEKQVSEQTKKEWYENDLKDFENKYPDVDITKLDEDQRFLKFAKGKIGVYPLAEIYTDFVELFGELESTVKTELKNKLQRQQAYSQASVKINSASSEPTYYSMDQLRKMSKEEISKNYEKVMKSYEYHTTKK
jgi:hypothetical protein